jgi:hypothetical protein
MMYEVLRTPYSGVNLTKRVRTDSGVYGAIHVLNYPFVLRK